MFDVGQEIECTRPYTADFHLAARYHPLVKTMHYIVSDAKICKCGRFWVSVGFKDETEIEPAMGCLCGEKHSNHKSEYFHLASRFQAVPDNEKHINPENYSPKA